MSPDDQKAFKESIQQNKHEIYVVSVEEMDAIVESRLSANNANSKKLWEKLRNKLSAPASYYANADDAVTLTKLISDLGSASTRVAIKTYGGKPHIIIKGHAGLRRVLTGTKYGIKNPKVITMGLGKAGAVAAAKKGGLITIVLLSAFRVADYFLSDEGTLSRLIGTLATDVAKVGLATGASIAAATVMGATTLAIGPILAVVVVGFGVSYFLDQADKHFGITERLIAGLDELNNNLENYVEYQKRNLQKKAEDTAGDIIEFAVDSVKVVVIRWVTKSLHQYLSPLPRL